MSSRFKRKIENFVCGHCGIEITGDGYTNHCPKCLWSRHVDDYPGDRANKCLGMMEPAELLISKGEYVLIHRCIICGKEKKNRTSPGDNIESVIALDSVQMRK